jgi:hypothetical protein
MDGNVLYIHKVFGYQITPVVFRDHSLCGVGQAGISWKLRADILDGYRALEVMALAEEYLNIKYSDKRKRIFNIRCLRLDRINREKEQQQLLLKQKEADKINEYLATLKKKG